MKYRQKPVTNIQYLSEELFNAGMQYIYVECDQLLLVSGYVKN